ncbi:hypothetical protein [Corynebacterium glyciniphilum]|uniref:hypothetical protein n=1 Tax=Corynebacterium glyciniphilum TaxID=1404244 RepID=UPI0026553057|nr:hypothetical protein [Corynebacterium glyciniphilum]MDN5684208.1 cutinase family protein [Corynebacterium glyciniphilum]MDN6704658.1 cutinase family protein [Corynebacterium glyciniphilum]
MRKIHGVVSFAAFVVVAAAVTVGTAAAGVARDGDAGGDCPSVVALAARGSEENETYGPSAANGYSNGYEGETLHRFLSYASALHPGLFDPDDRTVLAIDADHYPARFPVGEAGEDPDPATVINGVGLFVDSMARGLPGGLAMVEDYEQTTACRPDYVGLGYSQGVAALTPVQHTLAAEGRLRGAVYFGNPFHRAPGLIGGGSMSGVPVHSYCLADDFACDTGPRSVALAVQDDEGAGAHEPYFRDAVVDPTAASPAERAAVDAFARLIR